MDTVLSFLKDLVGNAIVTGIILLVMGKLYFEKRLELSKADFSLIKDLSVKRFELNMSLYKSIDSYFSKLEKITNIIFAIIHGYCVLLENGEESNEVEEIELKAQQAIDLVRNTGSAYSSLDQEFELVFRQGLIFCDEKVVLLMRKIKDEQSDICNNKFYHYFLNPTEEFIESIDTDHGYFEPTEEEYDKKYETVEEIFVLYNKLADIVNKKEDLINLLRDAINSTGIKDIIKRQKELSSPKKAYKEEKSA